MDNVLYSRVIAKFECTLRIGDNNFVKCALNNARRPFGLFVNIPFGKALHTQSAPRTFETRSAPSGGVCKPNKFFLLSGLHSATACGKNLIACGHCCGRITEGSGADSVPVCGDFIHRLVDVHKFFRRHIIFRYTRVHTGWQCLCST